MTIQEALDRVLEALREVRDASLICRDGSIARDKAFRLQDLAGETLNEIQRGLWIEEVNRQVDLEEFCAARGISP